MAFNDLQQTIDQLQKQVGTLQKDLAEYKKKFVMHQHTGVDGSVWLDNTDIFLRDKKAIISGCGGILGETVSATDTTPVRRAVNLVCGPEANRSAGNVGTKSKNAQIVLQKDGDGEESSANTFLYGFHNINEIDCSHKVLNITSGQTVFTDRDLDLNDGIDRTGYYILFQLKTPVTANGTSQTLFCYKIDSNTNNSVTISSGITATGQLAYYSVFAPIYLGNAEHPWTRLYTLMGNGGGIRFGIGGTNNGQNTLLYDTGGNQLTYRNSSGVEYTIPFSGNLHGTGAAADGKHYVAMKIDGQVYNLVYNETV